MMAATRDRLVKFPGGLTLPDLQGNVFEEDQPA
ncbi:hypothetical protein SIAM614_22792 [Stappia aggregata IAM 12614]|uniref:Uncharacterized protein n=1 Tax=Roseibium aggregatum (strain ATCC 25650 / DSM 13394 / JCM 20685 / NBRC 16684 / NCIMB 2208 / IAM 12614 / B1) TaxID=384765 RepID=A0NMW5_ROSAI|nr:hypothetical protein SIAM614_22792 [Stappia aggregata IAM 12614] [Roseibium aggregatum IAM 12614]